MEKLDINNGTHLFTSASVLAAGYLYIQVEDTSTIS
jgi:hypothetical protein